MLAYILAFKLLMRPFSKVYCQGQSDFEEPSLEWDADDQEVSCPCWWIGPKKQSSNHKGI